MWENQENFFKGNDQIKDNADKNTEKALREIIQKAFPDDGILGEEWDEKLGTSGYRWILDPIDGTKSFIHGVPLYGTLIAVEYQGESVIGVISIPARRSVKAGRRPTSPPVV